MVLLHLLRQSGARFHGYPFNLQKFAFVDDRLVGPGSIDHALDLALRSDGLPELRRHPFDPLSFEATRNSYCVICFQNH